MEILKISINVWIHSGKKEETGSDTLEISTNVSKTGISYRKIHTLIEILSNQLLGR